MTEAERPPTLVGTSDRRCLPAGIQSSDDDAHGDSGAVGYRPRGVPPSVSAVKERGVSGVVSVGRKRCGSQFAGIQVSDGDTHSDAAAVGCRQRGIPPPQATTANERANNGVVKVDGTRRGSQSAGIQVSDGDTHSDVGAVEYRPRTIPPLTSAVNERKIADVVNVGGTCRGDQYAGSQASDADTHHDIRAVGYRARGDMPPRAGTINERNVSDVAKIDSKRWASQSAGPQTPDADTHKETGVVDCRPRGFPPQASSTNERNVPGVVKVDGTRCGGQSIRPVDRASGRFAVGTAVRAGGEVGAEPPLSAAERSGKEANERARRDGLRTPPLLECRTDRATGVRLR